MSFSSLLLLLAIAVCESSSHVSRILADDNNNNTNVEEDHVVEENMNFIPDHLYAAKYVFFSINVVLCIVFASWTLWYQNEWIVKSGQPKILLGIIFGCFVANFAIMFTGVQTGYRVIEDPENPGEVIDNPAIGWVDFSCMAEFWFWCVGHNLVLSLLIVKIKRVQIIHKAALKQQQDKKNHGFKDVAYIVAIIMGVQFAILILFQALYPRTWERVPTEYDEITGYPTESYGECLNANENWTVFIVAIIVFEVIVLLYALVICWRTSDFDEDFAESNHMSLAILLNFQMMLLLVPVRNLINRADVEFVVSAFHLFLSNFFYLTILFIPKMMKLHSVRSGESIQTQRVLAGLAENDRWDTVVDGIDGILDPDGNPYHAMTEEERNELRVAKSLLLEGAQSEEAHKLDYIPQELEKLIEENTSGGEDHDPRTTYRPKRGVHLDESVRFLVREYGGININASAMLDEESIRYSGLDEDENNMYHIPIEFHALTKEEKLRLYELLSWKNLNRWDYDIFELNKASGGHPLLFVGYALLGSPHSLYAMGKDCGAIGPEVESVEGIQGYHFVDHADLHIPMRKLCNYLRTIEQDYTSDNPYHNEIHGADVVQSMHALIQMKGDILPSSTEELFSILLSAVVHDVNHPGENNSFQQNSKTELALVYNDISILENRHASHAFMKMITPGKGPKQLQQQNSNESYHDKKQYSDNNLLCNVKRGTLSSIRKKVIGAVLHTDMSKHFQSVDALKAFVLSGGCEKNDDDASWKVLQYMLHLADISNPAKPKDLALLWTDRCLEEFFAQGDKEFQLGLDISPNCDRATTKKPDSQIGFITFVIKPAYEVLAQIIPRVKTEIVTPHIDTNLQYWQKEKEDALKKVSK